MGAASATWRATCGGKRSRHAGLPGIHSPWQPWEVMIAAGDTRRELRQLTDVHVVLLSSSCCPNPRITVCASAHRRRVSASALSSRASAAASPAQSGEKSPLPRFSAAARSGAAAPAAKGNCGASSRHRSDFSHEPIDQAPRGPPCEHVCQPRCIVARACERGAMQWRYRRLRRAQIGGADLNRVGAERKGRRDCAPIADFLRPQRPGGERRRALAARERSNPVGRRYRRIGTCRDARQLRGLEQ